MTEPTLDPALAVMAKQILHIGSKGLVSTHQVTALMERLRKAKVSEGDIEILASLESERLQLYLDKHRTPCEYSYPVGDSLTVTISAPLELSRDDAAAVLAWAEKVLDRLASREERGGGAE